MVASRVMASARETYGRTLVELSQDHPNIVVLGGDLNISVFTHLWREKCPDRFFDFGPAEQNIMGVAAGLAASGKVPFVSTFAVFGTARPFDQLRVLIAQPQLNVKLVCTHAGVLTGGLEPAWLLSGTRGAAADTLPGDEWTWRAGLGWLPPVPTPGAGRFFVDIFA